jgi:hypothetical protein
MTRKPMHACQIAPGAVARMGLALAMVVIVFGCLSSRAADPAPAGATIDAAVDRGVGWLLDAQRPDGSWGSGGFRGSAAVTAQVVLALVADGSTPASGPHAAAVARGIDYLVACAGADGVIAGNEQAAHGPMYGHAFAMTALAAVYGETNDDSRIAEILGTARDLLERTQNDEGGWRYQPVRRDADLSVTAAVLVALRSLHDVGFEVSSGCVDRATDYLRALANPDGGFRYLAAEGPSGAPRTAAAVFALVVAGRGDDPAVGRGIGWLDAEPLALGSADGYALYGLSYEAAVRWRLRGKVAGFDPWHATVAARLLAAQRADGAWTDPSCPEYGTAAAVAVLRMPAGLVPLFQDDASGAGEPLP